MTDATLSYARALRRYANDSARARTMVTITIDPVSAAHLADVIERGCQRSVYVRTVQKEAERLRDMSEDELLEARDLNAAADRALQRARIVERSAQAVGVLTVLAVLWLAGVAI